MRVVGQLEQLLVDRFSDLAAAVTDVDAPEARHTVEVVVSFRIGDGRSLTPHHHFGRAIGQLLVLCQRVPDVIEISLENGTRLFSRM